MLELVQIFEPKFINKDLCNFGFWKTGISASNEEYSRRYLTYEFFFINLIPKIVVVIALDSMTVILVRLSSFLQIVWASMAAKSALALCYSRVNHASSCHHISPKCRGRLLSTWGRTGSSAGVADRVGVAIYSVETLSSMFLVGSFGQIHVAISRLIIEMGFYKINNSRGRDINGCINV